LVCCILCSDECTAEGLLLARRCVAKVHWSPEVPAPNPEDKDGLDAVTILNSMQSDPDRRLLEAALVHLRDDALRIVIVTSTSDPSVRNPTMGFVSEVTGRT
jgi:hypothetical protein